MGSATTFIIALSGLLTALITLVGLIVSGIRLFRIVIATHTLCNSAMGASLKATAKAEKALAAALPTPENLEAAALSEAAYQDHQRKQRIVDGIDKNS